MSLDSFLSKLGDQKATSYVLALNPDLRCSAVTENGKLKIESLPVDDLKRSFDRNEKLADVLIKLVSSVVSVSVGLKLHKHLRESGTPTPDIPVDPFKKHFLSPAIRTALTSNATFLYDLLRIKSKDVSDGYSDRTIAQGNMFVGEHAFEVARAALAGSKPTVVENLEVLRDFLSSLQGNKYGTIVKPSTIIVRSKTLNDLENMLGVAMSIEPSNIAADFRVIYTYENNPPNLIPDTRFGGLNAKEMFADFHETTEATRLANVFRKNGSAWWQRIDYTANCTPSGINSDQLDVIRKYNKATDSPDVNTESPAQWVTQIKYFTPFMLSGFGTLGLLWALHKLGKRYVHGTHILSLYYTTKDLHCVRGTRLMCSSNNKAAITVVKDLKITPKSNVKEARARIHRYAHGRALWFVRPNGELRPTTIEIIRAVEYYT